MIFGLNTVGLKRAGFTPDERNALRKTFREIFMGSVPITDAARNCKEAYSDLPVQEFTDFILDSKRGVCGYSGNKS
jgi:UDP-N-acetylglucosamine acyltransferase